MELQRNLNLISDPISELLFEENPAGLVAADSRGTILRVNRAFCNLLNCPKELCLLYSWQDLLGISNDSMSTDFLKLSSGHTKEISLEKKILINNTKPLWVRIHIKKVQLETKKNFYFLAALFDITESKRSEEALLRSELRFKSAEKATRQVIWEWNRINNKISWNHGIENLGYSHNEIHSDVFWWIERIHADDRERILFEIERSIEQKKDFWRSEYRFLKANGQYAIISDRACIEYDKKMKAISITGSKLDITDRKNDERELLKAKSDAQKATQVKSEFIANMSHEIRTPLSAILGFADILSDKNLSQAERDNCIHRIKRNGRQLFHLVNEVLDLSKLEAGNFEIQRNFFPLTDITTAISAGMKFKAEEKGLKFKMEFGPLVPDFVKTDRARLQQVLFHLIGNAIKFTHQGTVSVAFEYRAPEGSDEEGILKCRITDTGIGLKSSEQEKLFKSFSQADSSMTRKYGGTGLGLAVSKKIAHALGGDVELLSSIPQHGSIFQLTVKIGTLKDLQLANAKLGKNESINLQMTAKNIDLTGVKVLLVDDSPDNRALLTRILSRKGVTVMTAENGLEGHNIALKNDFHLVLMDVQMPVMGGYEATQLLRQNGFQKPIIAFTAHTTREDREASLKAGFDDHLTKPVDQSTLFNMINHYGRKSLPPTIH